MSQVGSTHGFWFLQNCNGDRRTPQEVYRKKQEEETEEWLEPSPTDCKSAK